MKIVEMVGRLGNQMFIYAFGKALEYCSGDEVLFDTSFYVKNPDVSLEIEKFFNVKLNVSQPEISKKVKNKGGILKYFFKNMVKEKVENKFDSDLLKTRGDKYFRGYFQCEKYFKDIKDVIKKDFTFKPVDNALLALRDEILNFSCPVFLHIRRGDYVELDKENSGQWLCDMLYYKRAAQLMKQKYPECTFIVFSDDPEWVKDNLDIGYPFKVYSKDCPQFDMYLMQACCHGICANSSYSWWAAWLIDNPDKTIIAPEPWFAPGNDVDIVPKSWVKVSRF